MEMYFPRPFLRKSRFLRERCFIGKVVFNGNTAKEFPSRNPQARSTLPVRISAITIKGTLIEQSYPCSRGVPGPYRQDIRQDSFSLND